MNKKKLKQQRNKTYINHEFIALCKNIKMGESSVPDEKLKSVYRVNLSKC